MVVGIAAGDSAAQSAAGSPDLAATAGSGATDASGTAAVVAAMQFDDTVEGGGIPAPVAGSTAPGSDETATLGFGGIDLAGAAMASADMGTAAGLASGAVGGGSDFGASGAIAGDAGAASAVIGGGGPGFGDTAVTNSGTIGGSGATRSWQSDEFQPRKAEPFAIFAISGSAAIEFRCCAPRRDLKPRPTSRESGGCRIKALRKHPARRGPSTYGECRIRRRGNGYAAATERHHHES
jgi:hypothetical protein